MSKRGFSRRGLLKLGLAVAAGSYIPSSFGQSRATVQIVNTSSSTVLTMQALLHKLGYLEEFGIDANTINVSDGSKVLGALISGQSDICMLSGFGQVLPAIERGAKLKIVAGALLRSNSIIYSARPDIQSVKDLEGRTVGSGAVGSGLYTLVVTLLRRRGVDPAKVKFVNVGSATDVFKAVAAGTVDAGPAQVEFMSRAAELNVHALSDGAFWEQLPDYSDQGSYTSDSAIARKRDALVRVLAAYGKLYRFVSSPGSQEAYLEARKVALGAKSDVAGGVALWEFIQKYQAYALNLAISEARMSFMEKLNIEAGAQKTMLPFTQVADMSLARDAVALLGGPVGGEN